MVSDIHWGSWIIFHLDNRGNYCNNYSKGSFSHSVDWILFYFFWFDGGDIFRLRNWEEEDWVQVSLRVGILPLYPWCKWLLSKCVGFWKSVMCMSIVSRWLTQKTDTEVHYLEKKGVTAAECLCWWLAFEDRIETAMGIIICGGREDIGLIQNCL